MLAAQGCSEDVPTIEVTGTALHSVDLTPPDDHVPDGFGHYRWNVVEAPPDTSLTAPAEQTAAITIDPPRRGIYIFDRWFVSDTSEQLSCHVIVDVSGAPPTAHVDGPSMVAVGQAATFDGSMSASPEGRAVSFQWRLALRPEASTADLADATTATLMLVPDVAGNYGIELRVFDGELWSDPATTTLTAR